MTCAKFPYDFLASSIRVYANMIDKCQNANFGLFSQSDFRINTNDWVVTVTYDLMFDDRNNITSVHINTCSNIKTCCCRMRACIYLTL